MNHRDYAAYLLAMHGDRQYRFARSLTGDGETADDLCQEVWCNVLTCKSESRPNVAGEFSWLCRVTKNAWISAGRKKKARIGAAIGEGASGQLRHSQEPLPDICADKKEQIKAMEDCIEELPDEFRIVMKKRQELLGNKEIAEELQIPQNTVASRVSRGFEKLKACMTAKGFT